MLKSLVVHSLANIFSPVDVVAKIVVVEPISYLCFDLERDAKLEGKSCPDIGNDKLLGDFFKSLLL